MRGLLNQTYWHCNNVMHNLLCWPWYVLHVYLKAVQDVQLPSHLWHWLEFMSSCHEAVKILSLIMLWHMSWYSPDLNASVVRRFSSLFIANACTTVVHIMADYLVSTAVAGCVARDRKVEQAWRTAAMQCDCVICSLSWNQSRTTRNSAVGSCMKMKKQSASISKSLLLFWFVKLSL